ncbi:MAG: DUF1587 domain-containing protein, partial [Gemmataceae bacterium]
MGLPSRFIGVFALTAAFGLWVTTRNSGAPPASAAPVKTRQPTFTKDVVPFLTKHCYACHGNGKKRGELSLDKYKNDEALQKDRKVWENVLQMIRGGEMPPKKRKRPKAEEIEAVLRDIEGVLANIDCTQGRHAGRVTLRRLNRAEYNNTIRDLVGVDFKPATDFPNDDVGYGFDNIGDVLSLSPLLLEKYLAAAESILDKAIVLVDPPKPRRITIGSIRFSPRFGAGEQRRRLGWVLFGKGDLYGESYCDEGDYAIRVEAFGQQVGEEPVRAMVSVGETKKAFAVKAKRQTPETLELKVKLKAGTTRVRVSFLNPHSDPEAKDKSKKERLLVVREIVLDGPYNAPAPKLPEHHTRIMAHKSEGKEREAAREIVTRFATRAFRRPAKAEEVERFLKLYDKSEKSGARFEKRVRLALCGVLVSPYFLFRVELDPPDAKAGTTYAIDELELASRLSYFLWSSMPDDELFTLAAKGQLRKN